MSDRSCEGAVLYTEDWCPECDRKTPHIRVSKYCVECSECGEPHESNWKPEVQADKATLKCGCGAEVAAEVVHGNVPLAPFENWVINSHGTWCPECKSHGFVDFDIHSEECQECRFWPVSPACEEGAKILKILRGAHEPPG